MITAVGYKKLVSTDSPGSAVLVAVLGIDWSQIEQ